MATAIALLAVLAIAAAATRPVLANGEGKGAAFSIIALDIPGQRAVVRPAGERPVVVAKGDPIPGTALRVVGVLSGRIEAEVRQPGMPLRRVWCYPGAGGSARLVDLERGARGGQVGVAPAFGGAVVDERR